MANTTNRERAPRRTYEYSVYVVELDESKRRGTPNPAVYVGQTVHSPEQRLAQHLSGEHSSRHVRGHAVQLRPDLYEEHNPLPTRAEAEAKEAWLADQLRSEGYDVYSN
jgi:predicted GIY-YIG superfamily endonuclease